MRFVLICLAAVLLSGCGYIAGKRVDFGSDFSKYPYDLEISQLAGETFYISNYEDYERLIQLKKDLRELYNSPTPTKSLQASCAKDILQITNQYDSGYLGFFYWGKVSKTKGEGMAGSWADSIWCVVKVFVILLAPIFVIVGIVTAIGDFIKGLFKQSK
jgi:hypothetical protein